MKIPQIISNLQLYSFQVSRYFSFTRVKHGSKSITNHNSGRLQKLHLRAIFNQTYFPKTFSITDHNHMYNLLFSRSVLLNFTQIFCYSLCPQNLHIDNRSYSRLLSIISSTHISFLFTFYSWFIVWFVTKLLPVKEASRKGHVFSLRCNGTKASVCDV